MEKRTVLVTGANSGIGLATAIELSERGHRVIGTVRSEEKAAVLEEHGIEHRLLDVTDAARCAEVVKELPLDALVNNAGYAATGAVEDIGDDEASQQLEAMVIGPIRLARLVLPGMRARGGGRIINVSSILARTGTPLLGWYVASKQALEGLSHALRLEVASDGIHVVVVEPGAIRTSVFEDARDELDEKVEDGSDYERSYDAWSSLTKLAGPLMADPAAVARVVATAVEADRPKARYRVGLDAEVLARIDRIAPARVKDFAARALLRL